MDFKKPLAWFAKKIIAKHKPLVIGITGSVGKTSTRHAIAAVLATKFTVREPEKNYNNEIGIPLTVIGTKGLDEGGNFFSWFRIFADAAKVLWLPAKFPKIAVLEYGIDHPGDMDALLAIVQPSMAVITTIGISHREHFNNESEIAVEKGKIAAGLPDSGTFFYNIDDTHVVEQTKRTKAKLVSFGMENPADFKLEKFTEHLGLNPRTELTVQTPTRKIEASIPVIGKGHLSAAITAVAVGEKLELEPELIIKGLANYQAVPGRLNILAGIKRTTIIDDTYNAAPSSMTEALHLLGRFPGSNKIAVLGDMLELGDLTESSHQQIGHICASMELKQLITVGEYGAIIARSAKEAGMDATKVLSFDTSSIAKQYIRDNLLEDSTILVKGSQGARMEKIVKEILAEPMSATEVLTRQYGKWLDS